jgi:CCR4-NOT transcription complex subunit 4
MKIIQHRRHLSDVRVVQKNLVFVVGLSHRLADAEILKKNEYFGKFGKITKVVINASPSYAGAQTPSASAYVTYSKADEALKAIQTVNNVQIDSRVLKASLGTTKYCSHFLKGNSFTLSLRELFWQCKIIDNFYCQLSINKILFFNLVKFF